MTHADKLKVGYSKAFEEGYNRIQKKPEKSGEEDVWLSVISDMKERRAFGLAKYGTPLQPNNGRDSLIDAYQEALDLAVYLKQKIMEDK